MAFSGTQQKCKACDKTVHFVDALSADGATYHNTCFKCSRCNGQLAIGTYSSMDGVLYCKPHFEQLFKQTSNLTKKFQTAGMRQNEQLTRAPSKLSSFFYGTQDKCSSCKKTVYPLEKITVEGEFYHKSCFRCAQGGCFLNASSYAALGGFIYCKHHFAQLFKQKGSYSYLSKAASLKKSELQQAAEKADSESIPSEAETAKEQEQEQDATRALVEFLINILWLIPFSQFTSFLFCISFHDSLGYPHFLLLLYMSTMPSRFKGT